MNNRQPVVKPLAGALSHEHVKGKSGLTESSAQVDYATAQKRERAKMVLGNHQLLLKYAVQNNLVSSRCVLPTLARCRNFSTNPPLNDNNLESCATTSTSSTTAHHIVQQTRTPLQIPLNAVDNSKYTSLQSLPFSCPGCGAISQAISPEEAGFYSRGRKAVKNYIRLQDGQCHKHNHLARHDAHRTLGEVYVGNNGTTTDDTKTILSASTARVEMPVCDRCHDLLYNNKGQSILHPSVEALADSIAESSFNRNHIYHVLDAADFPMSLIPKLFQTLEVAKPRSQNRRARTKFSTKPTISFIITRSDLLGPSKQMVDRMMPYFQTTLRHALGREARNMRMGNVHLVSSKRGWWTKEIKEDIWNRGGGNWMIGKANVGKSNLFPVLFPKGSGERAPAYAELEEQQSLEENEMRSENNPTTYLKEDSLLPPAQPETPFPSMPVVSHLPGTTVSPIRLPFGNHKGELVDLPGLDRGSLEQYVKSENKLDLVMQYRPNVKQHIIKPGQSLLIGGGLVRITPNLDIEDPSTTMLAYPFVPFDAHVTATEKASATQRQDRDSGINTILADGAGSSIKSCGIRRLNTDVTKSRAGALLRAGVPLNRLPFRVYSTDIIIEGVGWVELVCQVRKRTASDKSGSGIKTRYTAPENKESLGLDALQLSEVIAEEQPDSRPMFKPFVEQIRLPTVDTNSITDEGFPLPEVEIFSPNAEHVGQRKSLGAWMLWNESKQSQQKNSTSPRPRRSMKGVKRREKAGIKASQSNTTTYS